jgi:MFS family permease
MTSATHRTRTLWLVGALHAFTHIYQVALIPLYLKVQANFHLESKAQATLLVTLMNVAYFAPAYPMGALADRFNRKQMLGFGLLVNALGYLALAVAPTYPCAIAAVMLAGLGGSAFHPAATGLVAGLFPESTGRALGFIGVGASVGFCFGPLYAGWRADMAGDWRAPILELGAMGLIMTALFFRLAEADHRPAEHHEEVKRRGSLFPTPALWALFLIAALIFCARDFTGGSMTTLGSLFLQQALGFSVKHTGLALSCIFIASALSNPLFGHLSDKGRVRWGMLVLLFAAAMVCLFPHVPAGAVIPVLMTYGFFFMANYPIAEAALMEAVPGAVRGRVFGLWITIGGLIGNLAHWLNGRWVEALGAKSAAAANYVGIYTGLAALLTVAIIGMPCLEALRRREQSVKSQSALATPLGESPPATP